MKRALLSILAILALASCGDVRGDRVATGYGADDSAARVAAPQPDVADDANATLVTSVDENDDGGAFDFDAVELYGRSTISGRDIVENQAALITFVVPSCVVCVREGPEIAASAEMNPDVTYVIVHTGGTEQDYVAYVERSGLYFENIVHIDDSNAGLWKRFGVLQQPTTLLVGEDGSITQSIGALEQQGLAQAVDIVLGRGR